MIEQYTVRVMPWDVALEAEPGANLYELLRSAGLAPEAYCGGQGKCDKCSVSIDGEDVLACRTNISRDMTVTVPLGSKTDVLSGDGRSLASDPMRRGPFAAFDIGTTTVVCFLMDDGGSVLASAGELNPQVVYGGDVVSRLRSASSGTLTEQSRLIRRCMCRLLECVCAKAGVDAAEIGVISVVGNPTMQQLFLGLDVSNLITVPFIPALKKAEARPARELLPVCPEALLLTVPDVSGYIGADTVACVLSTELYRKDCLTLMIDIGTNGEIVLGNKERMLACATAAGPALEGANILFGMRAAEGAIDRVYSENGEVRCHVIGEAKAVGICGSGLIDAAAVFLKQGRLDRRGRILPRGWDRLELIDGIYLTQNDVRELQLAKSAIASGIKLLAERFGAELPDVERVYLAGAFGSFISPENACRIGLIPPALEGKLEAVGNAAGAGARSIACSRVQFEQAQAIAGGMELAELAALPGFRKQFAVNMYFSAAPGVGAADSLLSI